MSSSDGVWSRLALPKLVGYEHDRHVSCDSGCSPLAFPEGVGYKRSRNCLGRFALLWVGVWGREFASSGFHAACFRAVCFVVLGLGRCYEGVCEDSGGWNTMQINIMHIMRAVSCSPIAFLFVVLGERPGRCRNASLSSVFFKAVTSPLSPSPMITRRAHP